MPALAVTVPLENLIQMINDGVEAANPTAVAALAEWIALSAAIAGMAHLLSHVDPAVLAQAAQDAANCDKEDQPTNVH